MIYLSYLESKSEIFQNRLLADFVQKRTVKRSSVCHRFHHRHVVLELDLAALPLSGEGLKTASAHAQLPLGQHIRGWGSESCKYAGFFCFVLFFFYPRFAKYIVL